MKTKIRQGKGGICTFKDTGNPKAIVTLNKGMGINGGVTGASDPAGGMCEEFTLKESEDIFDYGTGDFTDTSDIFSTKTTGVGFYNELLNDPEYMERKHNLKGRIAQMTPRQYFSECAYNIFNTTPESLKAQRKNDTHSITTIRDVLLKHRRRLPLTYLNYAEKCQEGLHRMFVVGELFGWDKKYPVLVVEWADPEWAKEVAKRKNLQEIYSNVEEAVEDSLEYNYQDYDDWKHQMGWSLNKAFYGYMEDERNVRYDIIDKGDTFIVQVDEVEYEVDKDDIHIKDCPDEDDDDWDLDEEDWLDELDLEDEL